MILLNIFCIIEIIKPTISMETATSQPISANEHYQKAAKLLIEERKTKEEVKHILVQDGLDTVNALKVIDHIKTQLDQAHKDQANKDMLYGALWCIGGTIATIADIGYIFWGAIVFGGFQFIKGAASALATKG